MNPPRSSPEKKPISKPKPLDVVAVYILDYLSSADSNPTAQKIATEYGKFKRQQKLQNGQKLSHLKDSPTKYFSAVKQQATYLARAGKIELLKGRIPQNADHFKGVVKLRLKKDLSKIKI